MFALVTALYALLAYVPFTYRELIQSQILPGLALFARLHGAFYGLVLAFLTYGLREELGRRATRPWTMGFLAVAWALALFALARPVLPSLSPGAPSLVVVGTALTLLASLAGIDVAAGETDISWPEKTGSDVSAVFLAATGTALFVPAVFGFVAWWRSGTAPPSWAEQGLGVAVNVAGWLVVLLGSFVVGSLVVGIGRFSRRPGRTEFALLGVAFVSAAAGFIRSVVLAPMSLSGVVAGGLAWSFGGAIVAAWAGVASRLRLPTAGGVGAFLGPLAPRLGSRVVTLAWMTALAVVAAVASVRAATLDWNYLVQKVVAALVALLAFAALHTHASLRKRSDRTFLWLGLALLALGAHRGLEARRPAWTQAVLERHAGVDPSFRLVRDALRPDAGGGSDFYRFLGRNSNIARSVHVEPVEVRLVDTLTPAAGEKPNIFVIVIDSLRRDYVSPYNPAVTFTPSIGGFARESVAMENAFARYGATGLSEPSIWVGGMMIHKQYVTPFYPMNTLQKLLDVDGYSSFISMDTILTTVVRPSPRITELDQGVLNRDYDLCHSLEDLEGKLAARPADGSPVFAYTQPQNIHIAQITRQGASVPAGESYPGFYAPYASRLRRIDACFGTFVESLKAAGLYDRSIVILTADHGDSLGEEGRWGHAYTLYPEIVRIPLIVHLPESLKAGLAWDTGTTAFLTDITPSLYALLGHGPAVNDPILGRPLFTRTLEEQGPYKRDHYLLASSYGAVYGVLSGDGRSLFVADAVNYADSSFQIPATGPAVARPVTGAMRAQNESRIRADIAEINRSYGFRGSP